MKNEVSLLYKIILNHFKDKYIITNAKTHQSSCCCLLLFIGTHTHSLSPLSVPSLVQRFNFPSMINNYSLTAPATKNFKFSNDHPILFSTFPRIFICMYISILTITRETYNMLNTTEVTGDHRHSTCLWR